MAPERRVCDQDVRDRVTGDLGTTYLLEAGAGTGKTRVLVDRYVRCVLDEERGAGDVHAVAAITFTEKAAGELRQRIREELERRAVAALPGTREALVIRASLDALDDAPIATIHGFAGRLLREFPVEAGVDPAFDQLDQLGGSLERERLWDEWLTELAVADDDAFGDAGRPEARARGWLSRLLRAGVRLGDLRELAIGRRGLFDERYDIDLTREPRGEPDLASGLTRLAAPVAGLREFCVAACSDESDKGFLAAMDLVEQAERLCQEHPEDVDELAGRLTGLRPKATAHGLGGKQGSWSGALGGKSELWERYRVVAVAIADLVDEYAEFVTGLAIAAAGSFAAWAGATQLALGRLDFTDLLGRLRGLLRDDRVARRALQRRFRYLLVDEFQDTDPLQAEIVFFLCEAEPLAGDWREAVLEPGKLFVVGDPKQSIYRFRRADIAMYDQVKTLIDGQPGGTGRLEAINQNFRTTPAVANWVNNVFAGAFDADQAPARQPGYQWVEPYRPAATGPRVVMLPGSARDGAEGSADAVRAAEARAVAALLAGMRAAEDGRWMVQNRDAGRAPEEGGEPLRAPRWDDIALLYRGTTGLETLEEALRSAGVPFRVDGGRTYFKRREVDDALLCLRAIDDPSDGPALYGALHSTFFGFSDDDLVVFFAHGGRFDLFAEEQPAGHEEILAAMTTLRELHERRGERLPDELVADLLHRVRARELLAATGADGDQAIANLEKLVDRARAFVAAGGGGLGPFLDWAAGAGDAVGEEESHVDDAGDVVHLLTIHKAKGLEYPIVIVVGGGQKSSGGGRPEKVKLIIERSSGRRSIKLKAGLPGAEVRDLNPRSYAELEENEKLMAASETLRLLYVATTRARDWLIVSCYGKLTTMKGEAAKTLLGHVVDALPQPAEITEEYEDGGVLVLPPGEPPVAVPDRETSDVAGLVTERGAWRDARETLLAEARRPARATSPSGLEHVDEEASAGGAGAPPGRAEALALGSAVHRLMELCDLGDESSIERLAAAVASEVGYPDLTARAAELALACWRAVPVRAAAAAAAVDPGAVYRELPVGALIDDVVMSGAVDLLYRDDGGWVVVDYKTDRAAEPAVLLDRYRPQGAAYAVAVEAAVGGVVREVVFVAARADGLAVRVPVDGELRALARAEIAAAAVAGRAVTADELTAG